MTAKEIFEKVGVDLRNISATLNAKRGMSLEVACTFRSPEMLRAGRARGRWGGARRLRQKNLNRGIMRDQKKENVLGRCDDEICRLQNGEYKQP